MKSTILVAALMIALSNTEVNAVALKNHGIFDKMFSEDVEMDKIANEHKAALERKRIQLAEAEKEHEKLVADEEAEEKKSQEEAADLAEKNAVEDKRKAAEDR